MGLIATAALGAASAATPAGAVAHASTTTSTAPLSGITIALDPGHQLGNHNFPRAISRLVPAGGFRKACDTSGAMAFGVREPTITWQISQRVQRQLQHLGATVRMTRNGNRADRWGPCVNVRGHFGGKVGAALKVSVHADGAPSYDHGFHVITPVKRAPWTTTTAGPSLRLAKQVRAGLDQQGFCRSTYIGGGTALSIRSDLAGLNLSTVPAVMLEVGNMDNRQDFYRMTHPRWQQRYATAIVAGIRHFLGK